MPAGLLVTEPLPVPALTRLSCAVRSEKVAVADFAPFIVTVHVVEAPAHAPLQPVKLEPVAATAVSVTLAPSAKVVWQVAPQSMPAGPLVTTPLPLPDFSTLSARGGSTANVAVTALAASIETVQVERVPVQAPLQPLKPEPAAATAVSVTLVPSVKSAAQVAPQAMPAGLLAMEPDPVVLAVSA